MENNIQLRFELQQLLNRWVDDVVSTNGITWAMMEDAMNSVLVGIKDKVFKEYIENMQRAQQEAYAALAKSVEEQADGNSEAKEE